VYVRHFYVYMRVALLRECVSLSCVYVRRSLAGVWIALFCVCMSLFGVYARRSLAPPDSLLHCLTTAPLPCPTLSVWCCVTSRERDKLTHTGVMTGEGGRETGGLAKTYTRDNWYRWVWGGLIGAGGKTL